MTWTSSEMVGMVAVGGAAPTTFVRSDVWAGTAEGAWRLRDGQFRYFWGRRWLPGGLGTILLGVWLILWGVKPWISFTHEETVLAVLAIAAGAVLLIQRR